MAEMTKTKKKVLVAVNTLTAINDGAYQHHLLLAYHLGRVNKNVDFKFMVARRMSIDRFRNMAAKYAVQCGMDELFFIDDDMMLPPDTYSLLSKANLDIAMANVYIRGYPFKLMGFKYEDKKLVNITEEDLTGADSNGVIKLGAIGTAVSLIKVHLFKRVPTPWFLTGPHGTEDIYFCLKAKQNYKRIKIGMQTKAICGHLLDPEVINVHTKNAHIKYIETFMSDMALASQKEGGVDHGIAYMQENILPGLEIPND